MSLCLFQGTFNPIHNAHIRIAEYATKYFAPDGVLFIPAYDPPHKDADPNMAFHRYKMVELGIADYPKFFISDIEYKRKSKSYTYLTVCELYEKYSPKAKIKFLIGTDAFQKIESWYEAEKLKNLLDFCVFKRVEVFDKTKFEYLKDKGYNYEVLPLEFEDISSTIIRENVKNNISISGLVDKNVEEYIIKYGLYK